jgi:hypothetical protein
MYLLLYLTDLYMIIKLRHAAAAVAMCDSSCTIVNSDGVIGCTISTELHTPSRTSVNLNIVSAPKML